MINFPPRVDPSLSEPPINSSTSMNDQRPATIADVLMRVAHDGPMYAVVIIVAVLAIKGQASSNEMVITSLAAMLARSWPRAVQVAGKVGVALLVFGGFVAVHACTPHKPPTPSPKALSYTVELEECNRTTKTCEQSIACENDVRTRYRRFPLRTGGCE
jgi:hypothetical protein